MNQFISRVSAGFADIAQGVPSKVGARNRLLLELPAGQGHGGPRAVPQVPRVRLGAQSSARQRRCHHSHRVLHALVLLPPLLRTELD
jgi:hypothetical protein